MITINIDGTICETTEGYSIIDAARVYGIDIPTLGYDPRLTPPDNVEIAFVEIEEGGRIRYASATNTKVADGMVVRTETPELRTYRTIYLQGLLRNHYGDCVAPCLRRCPAHIDIQKYLYHVDSGNMLEALKVIKDSNPLPAVCGRVCPHPCEDECRRIALDGPVNINGIKRFVADWDRLQVMPYSPECLPDTGFKVAVIGAGPAGLTAAWFLRRSGHGVTIFEMQEKAGGMLRWGIPCYRLPEEELDEEIQSIVGLGVEIQFGKKLGRDFSLSSCKNDGYDAIFLGLGAQKATPMGVVGEDLPGVMSGIDFLARLARMERPDLGERVIVVGGGNTAMDAARSAVRLGAKDVTVIYRRTRHEMPAQETEIEEAIEEGVNIRYLTAPLSIAVDGSYLKVTCVSMELGEPDSSGRRRPIAIAGSDFMLSAGTVISAIGQSVDNAGVEEELTDKWGNLKADRITCQTPIPWIFSGGDCVTGPDIAIEAIGAGQRAALYIDQYLKKGAVAAVEEPYTCTKGSWQELPSEMFLGLRSVARREAPVLPPVDRRNHFQESTGTLSAESAMEEASRCLMCGCSERYGCDLRDYATLYGVQHETAQTDKHLPVDDNHPIITRDPGKCILCRLCLKVCGEMEGTSALSFYETNHILTIGPNDHLPLDLTTCVACGHCATICPTGALTIKTVLPALYRTLNNPKLKVVAQIAPAVRAAFGQYYDIEPELVMPLLSAGLRRLGFHFVFDTCWAADLTIMEEGTEFLSRMAKDSLLPQITSCCPAWVNYCEKMAPDILPHLSSCKSPQQMFGAVMKQYFVRQLNVDHSELCFVSIMPCNAKKYEAKRPEFSPDGIPDVDVVVTTTDIIDMFEERQIDPTTLEPVPLDAFFGDASGAGIIFGASGGVAEAALRLAAEKMTGERMTSFNYEGVRGLQGVKEVVVMLGGTDVRLAVVSGLQNAQRLIDKIRAGAVSYDLIEVMACPGGCINGSGNPAPQLSSDTEYRLNVLYRLDQESPIRTSQDNPAVQALYENWLGAPDSETSHNALHTTYSRRSMRHVEKTHEEPCSAEPATDVGICIGTNCYVKGSWQLLKGLSGELKSRGLFEQFRVNARFCTGQCEKGPNVTVGNRIIDSVNPSDAAGFIDRCLVGLSEESPKTLE